MLMGADTVRALARSRRLLGAVSSRPHRLPDDLEAELRVYLALDASFMVLLVDAPAWPSDRRLPEQFVGFGRPPDLHLDVTDLLAEIAHRADAVRGQRGSVLAAAPWGRRGSFAAVQPESWEPKTTSVLLHADAAAYKKAIGEAAAVASSIGSEARVLVEDVADCTVFAPPAIAPGRGWALVQVFIHTPEQAADAAALASEFDDATVRRARAGLEVSLGAGAVIDLELTMPAFSVIEPVRRLVWRGRAEGVSFAVRPESVDHPPGPAPGIVIVRRDGIPVGRVAFQVTVAREPTSRTHTSLVEQHAMRFSSAFLSYASQDRHDVLSATKVLQAANISYFQDVLSLDPGARWEQEIYRHIDECDLFLLFWSKAAKASQWVRREAGHALKRQMSDGSELPEIRPIILPPPPIELPWPELEHVHFDDKLVHLATSYHLPT